MFLKNFNKFYSSPCFRNYSFKKNIISQKKQGVRNFLVDTIEAGRINSPQDWKPVRQELINNESNRGQYTKNNIDAVILGYCTTEEKFDLGSNYINFLKEEEIKPNLAFIGRYLKFLYKMNEEICFKEGKKCQKDLEQLILKTYNNLRNEFPVLDSLSLENIIPALSLTSEWKKCLDLLKEVEISAVPNCHAYSSTVAAAFLNKEEDLGWHLLREMVGHGRFIESIVFLAYINSLKRLKNRGKIIGKLEQMLLFLQENDFVCKSEVVEKIMEFGKKVDLTGSLTVPQRGVCQNCNQTLKTFDLDNEEFEDLKNRICEKVIVGKDIFVKTNPQELERFNRFISNKQHFDVVLDGLNIAYSAGTKHPPRVLAALLAAVVSHFAEQNKEILVVGRHHMTRWPKESWSYIMEHSTVFLAQNISEDDPYLLYCALNSGKDTIIVTRDLMRGHKFLLKTPKYRLLFNRWLSQRQYQLLKVSAAGKPIFRYPPAYTTSAQKIGNFWHIPFTNDASSGADPSIGWLCLSPESS